MIFGCPLFLFICTFTSTDPDSFTAIRFVLLSTLHSLENPLMLKRFLWSDSFFGIPFKKELDEFSKLSIFDPLTKLFTKIINCLKGSYRFT